MNVEAVVVGEGSVAGVVGIVIEEWRCVQGNQPTYASVVQCTIME